jgi:hypothetical protein
MWRTDMNKVDISSIVAVLSIIGCLSPGGVSKEQVEAPRLDNYLPHRVGLLRAALADSFQNGKKNVADSDSRDIKRAKKEAIEWIAKTLRKDQLPEDSSFVRRNIVMLQNAIGPNDVAICRWERGGKTLTVVQTCTIIMIQVRPTSRATKPQGTKEAMQLLAKSTALGVFNEEASIEVREPTASRVVKKRIIPELTASSFDQANVQEYAGGIHGRCSEPAEGDGSNFNFWWRRVSWWTEDEVVVLYTLKTEGGAWRANYGDSALDAAWFEGSPSKRESGD